MNYASGTAFRRALEDRLRTQSVNDHVPLTRLRKTVAFDRLLARLTQAQPNDWVLKGGFALQVRLPDRARTTNDMDMLFTHSGDAYQHVLAAAALDLNDWTQFVVVPPTALRGDQEGAIRFQVQTLIDSRRFEIFSLDVDLRDVLVSPPEALALPALLDFAGIPATVVPCYPLAQQAAEKLHAYVAIYAGGFSTRVKDLVDIVLIANLANGMAAEDLRKALVATFSQRNTLLPVTMPAPPPDWARPFRVLAQETDLEASTIDEGIAVARRFLDPVLRAEARGRWQADTKQWQAF